MATTYEGIVAEINPTLLYFRLEDGVYINVAIFMAEKCTGLIATLPAVGEIFSCENLHLGAEKIDNCDVYYMCKKNDLVRFSTNVCTNLLWMIEDECLGISDMFQLMYNNEQLKTYLENSEDIILWYISKIFQDFSDKNGEKSCCEYENLPELIFSTISNLMSRELPVIPEHHKDWFYRILPTKGNQILIGKLYIKAESGALFFKDNTHKISCIISEQCKQHIKKLLNEILCISEFQIIEEYYDDRRIIVNYLHFDVKNMKIYEPLGFRKEIQPTPQFPISLNFQITKITHLRFSKKKGTHFWTLVKLLPGNEHGFLRFPANFAHQFQIYHEYTLHLTEFLQPINDPDFKDLIQNCSQFQVPPEAVVTRVQNCQLKRFLFVLNAENVGEKQSFRARLETRVFYKKKRQCEKPGFGLIHKEQVLKFEILNSNQCLRLDLGNWGETATPLGLIVGAIIDVRNVLFIDKSLCKTTPVTTLEVVKIKSEND